jgi:hypothetical protein
MALQPVLADNLLRMAGGQKPQYRIGGIHLHGNAGGLAIGQITAKLRRHRQHQHGAALIQRSQRGGILRHRTVDTEIRLLEAR